MIKVNIEVGYKLWIRKIKSPKKYFSKKLKKISRTVPFFKRKNIVFTILLTNSKKMKELNNKFRDKKETTDVLSFPFFAKKNIKLIKEKNMYIGDIAICYEIINIRSNNSSFFSEFDKVWLHGLLHLIGYDHIKNKDYFLMDKIEKKILKSFI